MLSIISRNEGIERPSRAGLRTCIGFAIEASSDANRNLLVSVCSRSEMVVEGGFLGDGKRSCDELAEVRLLTLITYGRPTLYPHSTAAKNTMTPRRSDIPI